MTRLSFCLVHWRDGDGYAIARARQAIDAAEAVNMAIVATAPIFALCSSHSTSLFDHAEGGQTIIVGTAFGPSLTATSQATAVTNRHVLDAHFAATELRDAIWGSYVAVIPSHHTISLFADPSGALPFDMICSDGLTLATNDLTPSLCRAIGFSPRIAWPTLMTTLVLPATAVHLPHLTGVRAATPGTLYNLQDIDRAKPVWNPAQIARDGMVDDDRLRNAVDTSTAAMATSTTALQLSGGLDSSIVLSSLCASGSPPTSITFATHAAGGDERDYASIVAEHCGSSLQTCEAIGLPSYEMLFREAPGAHPFIYGLDDVFEAAMTTAATEAGCDQILTGQGGDAVFFQPSTPLVAVDRARALGFGSKTFAALFDDARRTRSSIWHHLVPALADRFRKATVPTAQMAARLLTLRGRGLIAQVDNSHPWLIDTNDLPPGKVMHMTMLANSQIFHARRPCDRSLAVRHPLLTQPVLEAALAIPTYRLACGSYDRGLARRLFADRLPQAIIARRTKGDAAAHYSRAALANLPFLRTMLLDGVLVREGLVDRQAMDTLLTPEQLFYSLDYRALVMHASCEAWARYWDAA